MTALESPGESVNLTEDDDVRVRRTRQMQTAAAQAKAEVARTATARREAYERAARMLPHVVAIREEIADEWDAKGYHKRVSEREIANRLNAAGSPPAKGQAWSSKTVTDVLCRADERMTDCAVLECRTRMTALALSADFTKPLDAVHELEREYLDIIADALDLGHRMRGERNRNRAELLVEARHRAVEVAALQRASKPVSMAARERLWRDVAPIQRKVFE